MRMARIFFFIFIFGFTKAQTNRAIDSLNQELKKAKLDTAVIKLKIELAVQWRLVNLDSTKRLAEEIGVISDKADYKIGIAKASYLKGLVLYMKGDAKAAIPYYEEAIKVLEPLGPSKDLIKICINTGVLYSSTNNYSKSLTVYYKALKALETIKDDKLKSLTLGNIGTIHYYNYEFDKAIEFSSKALEIDKELNNESGVAMHLGNIGTYYLDKGTQLMKKDLKAARPVLTKAISNLSEAYDLNEKTGNKNGMALNMGNIASAFGDLGDTIKAMEFYEKAYKLDEELGNKLGVSRHLGNIGWMYLGQKKYDKAEDYMQRALAIVKELNDFALLSKWYSNLHRLYEETGRFDLALNYYKKSIVFRDSLFSIENAKKNLETEMNFEFEKKETQARQESEKQALIRNFFMAGFAVMFLMAILIFRSYRIKQKANQLISEQKELLEIKNKEITDSILYAKRIQNAHLPSKEYISKKMNELKKG
jgi:tetratricopeptide (TPR) repeat protein